MSAHFNPGAAVDFKSGGLFVRQFSGIIVAGTWSNPAMVGAGVSADSPVESGGESAAGATVVPGVVSGVVCFSSCLFLEVLDSLAISIVSSPEPFRVSAALIPRP